MKKKVCIAFLAGSLIFFFGGGCHNNQGKTDSHDAHEGTAHHEEEAGHEVPSEHAGEHDGHGHEGEEKAVTLSDSVAAKVGLSIDTVRIGNIERSIVLPGEIVPDGNRVLHVVPRFSGIVKEVRKDIGSYVKSGDVLAVVESNENLSPYSVIAHSSGRVIEKHVTPGEFVNEERVMFVVADLSQVWVNFAVYTKDVSHVAMGQSLTIDALGTGRSTTATISYISPVFNESTRSLIARAVISNTGDVWRPGTFVKATVFESAPEKTLLVCKDAIQIVDEKPCVFVKESADTYHPVPVKPGETGLSHTQILEGLSEGEAYVCKGAFELKAQLVVKSLGGHAGHGH